MNNFLSLKDSRDKAVGGKAQGLAELIHFGFQVPAGFVLQNATENYDQQQLEQWYQQIGAGKVAVRSSALGEDGVEASFAGQYETILNVEGLDQLHSAIKQCISSLQHERAEAYRDEQNIEETLMCVVVQQMVDAACAGVLFTGDPVSGRLDLLVIDATPGLGEALVSGEVTPDHYLLDKSGELRHKLLEGEQPVLNEQQLKDMVKQACDLEKKMNLPIDMEWAIDKDGQLFWLQARPITTLGSDLNELVTGFSSPDDVVTRCNIGEMMPGAVDPLTYSTSGWTIEHSMQYLHICYGVQEDFVDRFEHMAYAWGQLLINLSTATRTEANILGASNEQMTSSICGQSVPELKPLKKKFILKRIANFFKLLKAMRQIPDVIEEARQLVEQLDIVVQPDSVAMWQEIESHFPKFEKVCDYHIHSSSGSGFSEGLLKSFLRDKSLSEEDKQAKVAKMLAGAEGVESAELVEELDHIVDELIKFPQRESLAAMDFETFRRFLRGPDSELAGKYFFRFKSRHGHRGYRELSMRDPSWGDDADPVINTLHLSLKARVTGKSHQHHVEEVDLSEYPRLIKKIIPYAHECVRRREKTKSLYAKIGYEFKKAYRSLSEMLEKEGLLPEADLMYFYTRQELGEFILACNAKQVPDSLQETIHRAVQRRKALEFQQKILLPDISVGIPEPIMFQAVAQGDHKLVGRPVSQGIVTAVARVANTPAEAADVQPGEILIAPITDVGWTPYFASIAGLATDLGSAVSHGAVIAREYGLPCVVNLKTASKQFKTGELVRLDANTGTLERVDED